MSHRHLGNATAFIENGDWLFASGPAFPTFPDSRDKPPGGVAFWRTDFKAWYAWDRETESWEAVGGAGTPGPQGDPGPAGPQGVQGDAGPAGTPGAGGAAGPQGIQGLQGDAGPQGLPGADGAQGLPGADGAQGPQGEQGIQGNQGIQGVPGDPGADGAPGAPGVGVPAGGTAGQFIRKQSTTDFDTAWAALVDGDIPAGIARDSEVASAVSAHEGAADPHPSYTTAAEAASAASAAVATHEAASDPHTGYQRESEKGAASGYASLDTGTLVPVAQLGSGTPSGSKFLRDDRTWQVPAGGGGAPFKRVELAVPVLAALAWTNMPAALSFWLSTATVAKGVTKVDLTGFTQVRLLVNKQGTAGAAASKLILRYKASPFTQTVANYSDIGATEVSVATNVQNAFLETAWINLVAGAQADVFLALLGSGGDGVLDPAFGAVTAEFK